MQAIRFSSSACRVVITSKLAQVAQLRDLNRLDGNYQLCKIEDDSGACKKMTSRNRANKVQLLLL
jgi:hypothetical protein